MSGLLDKLDSLERERRAKSSNTPDDSDEYTDTLTPPPQPHEEMLYGLVGDVARAAAEGTEVNPVAAALAFLTFLGANTGRDVYFPVGNTWHHPRVYGLHIGRSGRGGKGDAQGLVHRIRRRIEEVHAGTLGQTHTGGLSTRAWRCCSR